MLFLSPRNSQRPPDTAASTLLRLLKTHLTQIFPHRDVDVGACLNEAFYGISFKEYIFFLVLRL